MNIGIDFDNTIAWYDTSFKEVALAEGFISGNWNGNGKTELRDHLRSLPDGETAWKKLQGRVYGKFMHRAEMMPGVTSFLLKCKARKHRVFIVSHKTEYGHFDPEKIPMRRETLKWMEAKRFFDPGCFGMKKENVFFVDTRKEKVEKIAELGCDCFIDDLPEVFAEENFRAGTRKILLDQSDTTKSSGAIKAMSNWENISNHVLGPTTDDDVGLWVELMAGRPFERIDRISGRGNSRLYKVVGTDGKHYALKYYPDRFADAWPRLKTEFRSLRFLRQHDLACVPMAVRMDEDLNLGLYEWIEGKPVTRPAAEDLQQAVALVERLHSLTREPGADRVGPASEACLSAAETIGQVEKRCRRLHAVSGGFPGLSGFLEQTFEPLWEAVRDRSLCLWPVESREGSLPKGKQTLNPSDFGFHNALKDGEEITFIDFEYFGWDDPVKLTADFLWHPAMDLNSEIAVGWKTAMMGIFSADPDFENRLEAAIPLYGLRWAMIILNEFLPGFAERRRNARGTDPIDLEKSRNNQLGKAMCYCERVKNSVHS